MTLYLANMPAEIVLGRRGMLQLARREERNGIDY